MTVELYKNRFHTDAMLLMAKRIIETRTMVQKILLINEKNFTVYKKSFLYPNQLIKS